jgi:hypothetical protein
MQIWLKNLPLDSRKQALSSTCPRLVQALHRDGLTFKECAAKDLAYCPKGIDPSKCLPKDMTNQVMEFATMSSLIQLGGAGRGWASFINDFLNTKMKTAFKLEKTPENELKFIRFVLANLSYPERNQTLACTMNQLTVLNLTDGQSFEAYSAPMHSLIGLMPNIKKLLSASPGQMKLLSASPGLIKNTRALKNEALLCFEKLKEKICYQYLTEGTQIPESYKIHQLNAILSKEDVYTAFLPLSLPNAADLEKFLKKSLTTGCIVVEFKEWLVGRKEDTLVLICDFMSNNLPEDTDVIDLFEEDGTSINLKGSSWLLESMGFLERSNLPSK